MNCLSKILLLFLALTVLILSVSLGVSYNHSADTQNACTRYILSSLRTLDETLGVVVSHGTCDEKQSEHLQYAFGTLDSITGTVEQLYPKPTIYHPYNQWFRDLSKALGSYYAGEINNVPVEGILYDGEISEKELQFLTDLYTDLQTMIRPLFDTDGINWRDDLTYDDLRPLLAEFLTKWGCWYPFADAPYELLISE